MRDGHVMKWMKDPLAGFISRCGARMGKFTALLVTIAMLAGTTGAGATAFADETVTDGGNVAAESAASQPESTQQSDAENAVGSDVADIAGQDVAGQSATDDDDAQCLTDDGESHQPSNEQAQSQLQSQSQPEQPSETMPEQRQPCDKTEQPNEQKEQERQAVRQPTSGATLRIDFMQGGASKLGKDLSEDDELPTGEWQYTFRGVMAGDYTVTEGNIAGYHAKGNVTSVPISITRADMWSAFDKGQTATYEASFTNVKETVAVLPLSGASEGRTWLVVAGVTALVLLLAGIVGLALIGRGRP